MTGTLDLSALEKVVTLMSTIDIDSWEKAKTVTDVIVQAEHKMLTTEEVGDMCAVSPQQVSMWRECGILRGTRTGKSWVFSQEEVRRFQACFVGKDISNRQKIRLILKEEKKEGC